MEEFITFRISYNGQFFYHLEYSYPLVAGRFWNSNDHDFGAFVQSYKGTKLFNLVNHYTELGV